MIALIFISISDIIVESIFMADKVSVLIKLDFALSFD